MSVTLMVRLACLMIMSVILLTKAMMFEKHQEHLFMMSFLF